LEPVHQKGEKTKDCFFGNIKVGENDHRREILEEVAMWVGRGNLHTAEGGKTKKSRRVDILGFDRSTKDRSRKRRNPKPKLTGGEEENTQTNQN